MKLCEVDKSKISPMMLQYIDIKEKNMDVILFFRLGDFYEMFFDLIQLQLDVSFKFVAHLKIVWLFFPDILKVFHMC